MISGSVVKRLRHRPFTAVTRVLRLFIFFNYSKKIEKNKVADSKNTLQYFFASCRSALYHTLPNGKVQHTCKEFLGEAIEFIIENDA